jgi:hypothetical protein
MKKFFTLIAFVSALTLSMISCTEEEVKPAKEPSNNQGGSGSSLGI